MCTVRCKRTCVPFDTVTTDIPSLKAVYSRENSPNASVNATAVVGVRIVGVGVGFEVIGARVSFVGTGVGASITFDVGAAVAFDVGAAVAFDVGAAVAFDVGVALAFDVGDAVAFDVGDAVAFDVCTKVAFGVGAAVVLTSALVSLSWRRVLLPPKDEFDAFLAVEFVAPALFGRLGHTWSQSRGSCCV